MLFKKFSLPIGLVHRRGYYTVKKDDTVMETSSGHAVNMAYASYETTSEDSGRATPLLIFHGLFGSKSNWNSFSKVYHNTSVPPQRKIFAVDARNHADSPFTESHNYDDMVLDLKKFLDTSNITKINLLGHCMGGRACMLFSLKYPELVEKLIVSDISPITTSVNFKSIAMLFSVMRLLKLPQNMPLSMAKNEVQRHLLAVVPNKILRGLIVNNLVQKSDGSYKWGLNLNSLLNNYESIASFPDVHNVSFDGPVMFLAGANSDFVQRSDLPRIRKMFPNAQLKYLENAGHWPHKEKPNEFLKLTVNFLNSQPQREDDPGHAKEPTSKPPDVEKPEDKSLVEKSPSGAKDDDDSLFKTDSDVKMIDLQIDFSKVTRQNDETTKEV
ncbi:protein ABHD11 [Aethina tumida]|uniref:protein ABHD11 n=1 Tax=Aethina tumida TaxID=116153 RepID=UPI00096B5B0F|nr:protein ABHD11 [Aethina tumida]